MKYKGIYKFTIPTYGTARGIVIEQENGDILEFWCDFEEHAKRMKGISKGDSVTVNYIKDYEFTITKN